MDRYWVMVRVYNFTRKHYDFEFELSAFDSLRTAQEQARLYIKNFNGFATNQKLREVWIESCGGSKRFHVYQ